MKLCVSEATTLPATFADDVEACGQAGCPALEVWLTKLEQHLETHSAATTRDLLAAKRVALAAAAYQGGLLLSQGEQRKAHFDHYRLRLQLCEAFGIRTLLVVSDFVLAVEPTDLERAVVSLRQAAQWADGFGVRLALEFRGSDTFCGCLDTAVRLVEACGEANVAVAFDVFHYYKGPSKFEDLDLVTPKNLAFVQLSDLAGVPREIATDADRILPGDGDLPLVAILKKLHERGYDGWVSLELMNPTLWQLRPTQVIEVGMAALQRVVADSGAHWENFGI
jgi:sugar phosphate isomerase/epimerase